MTITKEEQAARTPQVESEPDTQLPLFPGDPTIKPRKFKIGQTVKIHTLEFVGENEVTPEGEIFNVATHANGDNIYWIGGYEAPIHENRLFAISPTPPVPKQEWVSIDLTSCFQTFVKGIDSINISINPIFLIKQITKTEEAVPEPEIPFGLGAEICTEQEEPEVLLGAIFEGEEKRIATEQEEPEVLLGVIFEGEEKRIADELFEKTKEKLRRASTGEKNDKTPAK